MSDQSTGVVLTAVRGFPPNYADIVKACPAVKTAKGPMFCYGMTVFYTGEKPDAALMQHEGIHAIRQGDDVVGWWDRYLKDMKFRFTEELLAHRVEFAYYAKRGRNERRFQKWQIAARLSGPLYGNMVRFRSAEALITASAAELDDVVAEMMGRAM